MIGEEGETGDCSKPWKGVVEDQTKQVMRRRSDGKVKQPDGLISIKTERMPLLDQSTKKERP